MELLTMTDKKIGCRACRNGFLHEVQATRVFTPNETPVTVQLVTSECDNCGEQTTLHSQHVKNLAALAARKASYGDQLMGEEFVTLRKKYGLTQQKASKIFGKGLIAFSRYENEETYPDASTRLLIQLGMERADVLKSLADKAGVEIPLWKERCEDEQRIKVRPFVLKVEDSASVVVCEDLTYKSDVSISPHDNYFYHPKSWRRVSRVGGGAAAPSPLREVEGLG